MNNFLYKCSTLIGLSLALSACEPEAPTVTYYLEHPRLLEKHLQICMNHSEMDERSVTKCKTAAEAQALFKKYIQAEQADPEKFGQRILQQQTSLAALQLKIADLEKELMNADESKKLALTKQLEAMRQESADMQQEIKVLLAVAGLNSPE